ncbi:hypothetical protein GZH53_01695 [Flavihumibacter sp. R14]|nr:hypothetical protein [Flavihumibacter soli]
MSNFRLIALLALVLVLATCKDDDKVVNVPNTLKVTSEEFKDELLLVNSNDYQIKTSEPATFSSADTFIEISSTGLIKRLTSAEVVAIDVVSTADPNNKIKVYALGVNDENYDPSNVFYNGPPGSDPYGSYLKGWETLHKLPTSSETYALILRHADADQGKDYNLLNQGEGPPNWWKSKETALARQLSEKGRQRARDLGTVFKDLKYPITRVVSSEFYRAVETAELINAGPSIVTDGRLNHPDYNVARVGGLFPGMLLLMDELPVDNKMTLVTTHHPINELRNRVVPTFPNVIPFPWTGGYFVKIAPDKTITFEGVISYPMIKYYRDLKLKRL